jgi:hypothetical protein
MAKAMAMLTAEVVFPTPPFSLENTIVVGMSVRIEVGLRLVSWRYFSWRCCNGRNGCVGSVMENSLHS